MRTLADQRRRHRVVVLAAVLVDAHALQRGGVAHPVPDEIVAPLARRQIVVEPGDRVADDLLARRQEEHEIREDVAQRLRREVGLVGRAAPDVVAGVDRLHVGGDLGAHAGADAVAADHEVGILHDAVGEMHAHAAAVLLDMGKRMAEVIVRGIDGLAQQTLQPVPRGEDLRQAALADHTTGAVDGDAPLHRDAEGLGPGAALLQRLHQLRMGGDAGAAADQLDRRALVHVHLPADLAQERGREQARHRSTDDDGAMPTRHGRDRRQGRRRRRATWFLSNFVTGLQGQRCVRGCGGRLGVYYDTASGKIIPPGLKRATKSATILPTPARAGSAI